MLVTWVKTLYTTTVGPWKFSLIIRVAHLTTFSEKEMSEGILQSRQVKRVTIDSINKRIILKTNCLNKSTFLHAKLAVIFLLQRLSIRSDWKSFNGETAFKDIYIIQERNESRINWLANTAASLAARR